MYVDWVHRPLVHRACMWHTAFASHSSFNVKCRCRKWLHVHHTLRPTVEPCTRTCTHTQSGCQHCPYSVHIRTYTLIPHFTSNVMCCTRAHSNAKHLHETSQSIVQYSDCKNTQKLTDACLANGNFGEPGTECGCRLATCHAPCRRRKLL